MRMLCVDSVLPDTGIWYIISHSPRLEVLETYNVVTDDLFANLESNHIINSNLHKLIMRNTIDLSPSFSNTGLRWATTAFPDMEFLSLRYLFGVSAIPNCDALRQLSELTLMDISLNMCEIEKIVQGCKMLEKLYCKSLKTSEFGQYLHVRSASLRRVIFKNCLIEQVHVEDSPSLVEFTVSRLRNSSVECYFSGCNLRLLALTKLADHAVDAFLSALLRTTIRSKWLKIKCIQCAPSPRTIDEAFSKFPGNVLSIFRPDECKWNYTLKSILSKLGNLAEQGVDYDTAMIMWEPTIFNFSIQNNIFLRANFPIEPLVYQHSPKLNRFTVFNQCLIILTNASKEFFV